MAKRSTIADMIADQDPALMQEEVIIIESITQDTLDPLGRIRYFFWNIVPVFVSSQHWET